MKESVYSLRENGLPQPFTRLRNDEGDGKRIATRLTAVSPAGSVGASASQRCPPDTRTAMTGKLKYTVRLMCLQITKRLVIMNAKRERIRISLKRERIAAAVYTASQ